jgi:hypothetical protein
VNLKSVVLFVVAGCVVGFSSGLIVGRSHPAHNYQKYGETRFMLDAATGKLCDPFKDPTASTNLIDQGMSDGNPKTNPPAQPDPFAAYGGHEIKPTSNYPSACGK